MCPLVMNSQILFSSVVLINYRLKVPPALQKGLVKCFYLSHPGNCQMQILVILVSNTVQNVLKCLVV